jgi:adenosylcobinamide kinase/adenosylcobinamide-phosphate guanylyltransferase
LTTPNTAAPAAPPGPPLTTTPRISLILGGARSGKSRYAEAMIGDRPAIYVATAEARDHEMEDRIRRHQARRGANWTTCEVPIELAAGLQRESGSGRIVLVDCLTLWLSNLLGAGRDPAVEGAALVECVSQLRVPVIFVANEVGLGIVPDNALARGFRDDAGRLNQQIASVAERVVFVAAGLPLILKDKSS